MRASSGAPTLRWAVSPGRRPSCAGVAALYLQANYEKDRIGDAQAGYRTLAHVLGVRGSDVWLVAGVSLMAVLFIAFAYRPLLFTTFDEEVANATGIRTTLIDTLLMIVLAATVLATMNVMGVTLIAATLVVPAVVARMLTDSFAKMLAIATVIGGISGFGGMNLSYHHDLPSGSTIVLVGTSFFVVAYFGGGTLRRRAATVAHAH